VSQTASRNLHPAAGISLAEIFRRGKDLEAFRRAVLELQGSFSFTTADMIDLGRAYLERFPDREQDRNAEEVRLGYAIVRTAMIEKAVLAVDPPRRNAYRSIFSNIDRLAAEAEALVDSAGLGVIQADHDALAAALACLRSAIEEIPKGMIRERFIGGISYFFNILYALKMNLVSRRPG
jgi:hypothetical protein